MLEFTYVITDSDGLHARPAGELVKAAAGYACKVTLEKGGREVDASRIMGVMGLCVKQGMEVTVRCDGEDEQEAYDFLAAFFKENL